MLRNLLATPASAGSLGFAGLIPFGAAAISGLVLGAPLHDITLLAFGFAAMLLADLRLSTTPPWYRSLRLPLSVGAIGALLLGLLI